MSLLQSLESGNFHALAAQAAGVDEATARKAIAALVPAIASTLKAKAAADPDAFESLLDIIEDGDGSDLGDPSSLTDAEAISDGQAILADAYGSAAAARKALAPAAGTAGAGADTLMAISATTVLAGLSASAAPQTLAGQGGMQQAASTGGGGFFSILIAALLKGLLQGASRSLAPKRRRRRSYSSYYRRRAPTRRRRTRSVGLDDIFRSVLSGR